MAPILRTGIDLIEIDRLEHLNPAIRERFLLRVYTAREREEARGGFPYLAGRFAAKEAVAKALGCGIGPVSFKEIEIRRGQQGEPVLELHGNARELTRLLGLVTWSISISHTRTYAIAMVVALGSENEDSGRQ
jgi:holo-[acyl-carrier protein] synthase